MEVEIHPLYLLLTTKSIYLLQFCPKLTLRNPNIYDIQLRIKTQMMCVIYINHPNTLIYAYRVSCNVSNKAYSVTLSNLYTYIDVFWEQFYFNNGTRR